jgi:alkanesulfonate monooxygenase SsuD/methylene tetrahydromethanopterin reductase-like flavin-dependent oxidoreductase (luciferase family)
MLLPLRDPVMAAKIVASLDLLSGGRVTVGIGIGSRPADFVATRIPFNERGARAAEAIGLLRQLWTGEPVTHRGRFYQVENLAIGPAPIQKPHPPIWLPGVVSRDSLIWAAQKRIPYIMLATEMDPTRQAFQLYHDTAAEEGYESGPQNIGYLWKVHVDETEELAEETGHRAARWRRLCEFYPAPGISTERMELYVARGLKPLTKKMAMDQDEHITPRLITAKEALKLVQTNQVVDAKSIIGITWGLNRIRW